MMLYLALLVFVIGLAAIFWGVKVGASPTPRPGGRPLLIGGVVVAIVGLVLLGLSWWSASKESGQVFDNQTVPEFYVVGVVPDVSKPIAKNAVIRIVFSQALPDSILQHIQITRTTDGNKEPVPGSYSVENEKRLGSSQEIGSVVFQPVGLCSKPGSKPATSGCFDSGNYSINIDNETTSTSGLLLSCANKRCSYSPTVQETLNSTAASLTIPSSVTLPISSDAELPLSISSDSLYVRVTADQGQGEQQFLGADFVTTGEKSIGLPIEKFKSGSSHRLIIDAYDGFGHKTSARTTVIAWAPHCIDKQQNGDEAGPDCGGKDCTSCGVLLQKP